MLIGVIVLLLKFLSSPFYTFKGFKGMRWISLGNILQWKMSGIILWVIMGFLNDDEWDTNVK